MSNHHLGHLAKHGAEAIKELAPLHERKSPAIAFSAGLVFGALGVAIYLKSPKDFFICLGLFLVASVLIPGLGSVLGWFFAPVYGAWRAHTSNENLGL
jgi:predicted PurR-regulated permease PerM